MVDSRLERFFDKDHPAGFDARFDDVSAWRRRAASLRSQARVALGLHPMPGRVPLRAVVHGRIEREGYTVEKVFITSLPGHYVCGNLYRPSPTRAGPCPGVLSPHGHWPGGRFMWRSDEEIDKEIAAGRERSRDAARSPLQARCVALARAGCVVFHYDMVGFGDSTRLKHTEGFTSVDDVLHLRSFMGLQTFNSIRSMDFLSSLPDVDPQRIAVTGASSGATQCIALLAVDERPIATCPVVMVSMNMQGGCVCENAPLYRVGTNNVELACLAAPRPQEVVAADDWTRDFETRGLPEMRRVYALLDAATAINGKHLPHPHNYNVHSRERMYAFMNRVLQLGKDDDLWERPFEPLTPEQLSVFDSDHPRPSDEADAAAIADWWTRDAQSQLQRSRANADDYRLLLREALSAMLVDQLPESDGELETIGAALLPELRAGISWEGLLSRHGAGEAVPIRLELPSDWQGAVVLFSHDHATRLLCDGALARLLSAGVGVLAMDLLGAGEFVPAVSTRARVLSASAPTATAVPAAASSDGRYLGFTLGYNRAIIAERAHDVLSGIALLRSLRGARTVRLLSHGLAGPSALLASAVAGDAVAGAAIELGGFDFQQVRNADDPRLLPGGLKYGGLAGFASLCVGPTLVAGLSGQSNLAALRARDGVVVQHDSARLDDLIDFLLRN
jgi:hypothetical protein